MQMQSMGRLPEDVVAGDREQDPTPDYIPEAATPSVDVWAREQARHRTKNEAEQST